VTTSDDNANNLVPGPVPGDAPDLTAGEELRLPPAVFMVPAPDLQLRGTRAQVEAAFEAVGLMVQDFDEDSFRVHCTAGNGYAYSRDDRRFYFVGPVLA
jgi:hypothetical protein